MDDNQKDKIINILFLLDSSGSMYGTKQAAIDGFNQFLTSQREVPGLAELTLTTFSNRSVKVLDKADIITATPLNVFSYNPSGGTALFDAIGDIIVENIGSGRKTILAILTDGEENQSTRYNKERISDLIKNVQDNLGWEVTFLGANIANFRDFTRSLNMRDDLSTAFVSDNAGIAKSLAGNIGCTVTNYRHMHG